MAKLLLTLLICVNIAWSYPTADAPHEKNGMSYLGSFKQSPLSRSVMDFENHHYYVSYNPAPWSLASTRCKDLFGTDATLLILETEEEQKYINAWLASTDSVGEYWMGGLHDGQVWKWVNNLQLPNWAPWGSGYPTPPNSQSRVTFFHENSEMSAWRTRFSTQAQQYICEVKSEVYC